jgi:hypothetical protein
MPKAVEEVTGDQYNDFLGIVRRTAQGPNESQEDGYKNQEFDTREKQALRLFST